MKRTGEVVLGVIGAILYGLFAAFGGLMIWIQSNQEVIRDTFEQTAEQNPEISMGDFDAIIETMAASGWMILIVSLSAILLGIIAMVLIKGNKRPKLAGIIFILTAVITAIVTFGVGIIAGIFYLIAGIMCFARKPPRMKI